MVNCHTCGKEFDADKKGRKYCSLECSYASRKGHPPTNPRRRYTKTCLSCGKEFEAGGRTGKHHWTKYCSRVCAGHGAIRHPTPRTLSAVEAAYLAGFLDGEGSIVQIKNHGWRVTIYQSSEPVIRWIEAVTGTGTVSLRAAPKAGGNLKSQGPFKDAYLWQLYGRNAADFLEQLVPYMIVKKERAMEAINSIRRNTLTLSAGG